MGLDIHAASHLQYIRPIPSREEFDRLEEEVDRQGKCLDEVYFLLTANDADWKDYLAPMEPGLYAYTPTTKKFEFRAGAYSYYNLWRKHLCQFALGVEAEILWENPERFIGQPFVEIINFTDCDGRIGPLLATKLARDFRDHSSQAEEFAALLEDDPDFIENYRDFSKAFEVASRGALTFR